MRYDSQAVMNGSKGKALEGAQEEPLEGQYFEDGHIETIATGGNCLKEGSQRDECADTREEEVPMSGALSSLPSNAFLGQEHNEAVPLQWMQ